MIKITVLGALMVSAAALAHDGASGVVKERMDRFGASKDSAKAIRGGLKSGDFARIQTHARALNTWAAEMTTYFPEGSNPSPSEALDSVWTDWAGFSAKAGDYEMATARLLSVSQTSDSDATAVAFKQVMVSCKGCHDDYKAD
ncbi:hypothetical protein GH975_10710 [Litorivicinus lipolyticus]|uniref:Cytochrome c n=1 Tax=Litorivicinus lipolyticus TaxID=418701 RepID=A0A5Q2QFA3_9GAMM|nr:cytochrome c [Litorivicinus lipolyticus]QGG81012.1 hypothetical protein GH975_10710 [Litorivicinus lipolyticus]